MNQSTFEVQGGTIQRVCSLCWDSISLPVKSTLLWFGCVDGHIVDISSSLIVLSTCMFEQNTISAKMCIFRHCAASIYRNVGGWVSADYTKVNATFTEAR